jgi:hypothetical protein
MPRKSAWYTTSSTLAPDDGHKKAVKLESATPAIPKVLKSQPPMTAPTTPRTMSMTAPCPVSPNHLAGDEASDESKYDPCE